MRTAQNAAQIGTGLLVTVLGAFALVEASGLHMFGEHGIPGPGFFPDLSAGALVVLGILLTAANLRRPGTADAAAGKPDDPAEEQDDPAGELDPRRMLRAGRVWIGFAISMALLQLVGFLIAIALLVAYLLLTVEHIRPLRALLAVVLIPLVVYGLFAYVLGVELPVGSLFGET